MWNFTKLCTTNIIYVRTDNNSGKCRENYENSIIDIFENDLQYQHD